MNINFVKINNVSGSDWIEIDISILVLINSKSLTESEELTDEMAKISS